jgi:transposase
VADWALYTESNLKMMSDLSWLCPVPLRVKSAQSLISTLPELEFVDSNLPAYKLASKTVNYPGIEQRWLVVQSQERRESDLGKLSQEVTKSQSKAVEDLKKLSPEKSAGEADAIKGLSKLFKQFKYHQINQSKVNQLKSKKKDSSGEIFYQISATYSQNESKTNTEFLRAGRLFFADSIFLKSPERIESLGMIMGLLMLVYTLAQRQIRTAVRESKSTVKNQLGKPTDRPTLRWNFPCFQSIHIVILNQEQHISNWTQERDFIVNPLADYCFPYYQIVT